MVNIVTSHHHIFDEVQVTLDIVNEYIGTGRVEVTLNNEGPCAEAIGVYALLDKICAAAHIDKHSVTIHTRNLEEQHPEYKIVIGDQHWIKFTVDAARSENHSVEAKTAEAATYGMLYGVPSWDRMCLLTYDAKNIRGINIAGCKGIMESGHWNTFPLDDCVRFAPSWIASMADSLLYERDPYMKESVKAVTPEQMVAILPIYKRFYVDIVAETYTNGRTFFVTEKSVRPMLALTPFITQGPQGFLSGLRGRYGIKTFGDWWDEGYDDLQNLDRVKAICKLLSKLDRMTPRLLQEMYQEMMPVLEHNRQRIQEVADGK